MPALAVFKINSHKNYSDEIDDHTTFRDPRNCYQSTA